MAAMIFRRVIVLLLAAVFAAAAGNAIQLPGPDVPALLRVNSVLRTSFGMFGQDDHHQTLISRGGGVFELLATAGPSGPRAFFIRGFRGLGTSEELATLGRALVEAKVGIQGDCTLGGNPGHVEITWYGRAGRQNTFRVTYQEGGAPPGTQCSAPVVMLVGAIERFVGDAVSHLPQD
jgi:hypothetical protein